MKAIKKEPGKNPEIINIENSMEVFREVIGGELEISAVGVFKRVIHNKEGFKKNLPYNCGIRQHEFFGTIIIVEESDRETETGFQSLLDPKETLKELFGIVDTPEPGIESLLKDGKAFRIDSETFINIAKVRDANEAIVQFKGSVRDVVSIYLFAGAHIMGQLIRDGQDPEHVKKIMTGGIVAAADTAIKQAAADGKEG